MSWVKLAAFCVDAARRFGFGHLRRCLTLAEVLPPGGFECLFLCEQIVGGDDFPFEWIESSDDLWDRHLREIAEKRGRLDVIIVDSYQVDSHFMETIYPFTQVVLQMDDFGSFWPRADIVVNPTMVELDESEQLPSRMLVGPEYALLRSEFSGLPPREISRELRTVLVTLGGAAKWSDLGETVTAAREALGKRAVKSRIEFRIVVGPFSDEASGSTGFFEKPDVRLLKEPDMVSEMLNADVAVSAGGQTLFELLATGTPTVAVQTASNQVKNIECLTREQALVFGGVMGTAEWQDRFMSSLVEIVASYERRQELSRRGQQLVDGLGAKRVLTAILETLAEGSDERKEFTDV